MSESVWRPIGTAELAVGQRVMVRGIGQRSTVIVDVTEVDRTHEHEVIVVSGRQPWGTRSRQVIRFLHPDERPELYVDPAGEQ